MATADVQAPHADAVEEGVRLIALADEQRLHARLLGGVAFRLLVPEWTAAGRGGASVAADIDLVTSGSDARALGQLLAEAGYEPDAHYNALYGYKQLYFVDRPHGRPLDVVIDRLEMCHLLELSGRLDLEHPTLPFADLLLSKLQVVRLNRKDAADALGLLAHYPLADSDRGAINVGRITALAANDWGWWRTTTGNLDKLLRILEADPAVSALANNAPYRPADQIHRLIEELRAAPKSRRWKARALVGDRVRWYQEPEEVTH